MNWLCCSPSMSARVFAIFSVWVVFSRCLEAMRSGSTQDMFNLIDHFRALWRLFCSCLFFPRLASSIKLIPAYSQSISCKCNSVLTTVNRISVSRQGELET